MQNVLKQIGLDNYVDSIVKTNDKENPYLTAVNQLNLIGTNCIGVGTTAHDIENIDFLKKDKKSSWLMTLFQLVVVY